MFRLETRYEVKPGLAKRNKENSFVFEDIVMRFTIM